MENSVAMVDIELGDPEIPKSFPEGPKTLECPKSFPEGPKTLERPKIELHNRKDLSKYGSFRLDYFNIALLIFVAIGFYWSFSKSTDLPCQLSDYKVDKRSVIQSLCMSEPLISVWYKDYLEDSDYQFVIKNFSIRPLQFLLCAFIYAVWVIWSSRAGSKYVYNLEKATRHACYSDLSINVTRALLAYFFIAALPFMSEIPRLDFYANYRRELVAYASLALSHYGISYDLMGKFESYGFVGNDMFNETLYFQKTVYCNVEQNQVTTDYVLCQVNLQTYYQLAYGFFFFWFSIVCAWSCFRSVIVFNKLTHIFGNFVELLYFVLRMLWKLMILICACLKGMIHCCFPKNYIDPVDLA